MRDEAADALREAGYSEGGERLSMIEAIFDDLIDVPITSFRIADWQAIADYEWTETGGYDAKSVEDETEPNKMF